jgi:hypothetical protein
MKANTRRFSREEVIFVIRQEEMISQAGGPHAV